MFFFKLQATYKVQLHYSALCWTTKNANHMKSFSRGV